MPQDVDEYGIPVKTKPSAQVDEFGIPIKKKEGNGLEISPAGSLQPTSPSTSPNGKSLITPAAEALSFDKFSEFQKPVAVAEQKIPEWTPPVKPATLEESHSSDKAIAKNLWNSFTNGVGSLTAGVGDLMFQALQKITPSDPNVSDEQALKNFRDDGVSTLRTATTQLAGAEVSPEQKKNFDANFWTSSAGGLISSVPAMVSPAGAGLYIQAYDSGLQAINSTEEGAKLPESYKTIFGATVGTAQGVLEKIGLNKIFGKQTAKVATNMAVKTLSNLVKKAEAPITTEVFEEALGVAAKTLKKKVIDAGGKIAGAALVEFTTGSAQELSTVLAEKVTNEATGKKVFDEASWAGNLARIAYSGAQEAAGGGILGVASIPFHNTRNYIAEKVADAKTPEDITALKAELMQGAEGQKLSEAETQHFAETIDNYIKINQKIPADTESRKEVAEKIIEREDLKQAATEKLKEVVNLDDAFKPEMTKEIDALHARADEINDEITKIITPAAETKVADTPVKIAIDNAEDVKSPIYKTVLKSGDEESVTSVLKEVSDQWHDEGTREATERDFGKPIVDAAVKLFPQETQKSLSAETPSTETQTPTFNTDELLNKDFLKPNQNIKSVEFDDPVSGEKQTMLARKARSYMEERHNKLDQLIKCLT